MKQTLTATLFILLLTLFCEQSKGQVSPLPQPLLDEFGYRFNYQFQNEYQFRAIFSALIKKKNPDLTIEELEILVEKIPSSKHSQQIIFQTIYDWCGSNRSQGIYAILRTLDLSASKSSAIKEYILWTCDPNLAKENSTEHSSKEVLKEEIKYPITEYIRRPGNSSEKFYYVVKTEKSYFHTAPADSTRRNGYLVKGERLMGVQSQNGFVLTEFTNAAGKKSVGWIKLSDVEKNQ